LPIGSYVKSPVASLCLICSSVRNRVRVTMLVLIFSMTGGVTSPFPFGYAILGEGIWGRGECGGDQVNELVSGKQTALCVYNSWDERWFLCSTYGRSVRNRVLTYTGQASSLTCSLNSYPKIAGLDCPLNRCKGGGDALAEGHGEWGGEGRTKRMTEVESTRNRGITRRKGDGHRSGLIPSPDHSRPAFP
jgi:hypothetical protein